MNFSGGCSPCGFDRPFNPPLRSELHVAERATGEDLTRRLVSYENNRLEKEPWNSEFATAEVNHPFTRHTKHPTAAGPEGGLTCLS